MKVFNFFEAAATPVIYMAHQVASWGSHTIAVLSANPATVVITCIALTALGASIYLYKQLDAIKKMISESAVDDRPKVSVKDNKENLEGSDSAINKLSFIGISDEIQKVKERLESLESGSKQLQEEEKKLTSALSGLSNSLDRIGVKNKELENSLNQLQGDLGVHQKATVTLDARIKTTEEGVKKASESVEHAQTALDSQSEKLDKELKEITNRFDSIDTSLVNQNENFLGRLGLIEKASKSQMKLNDQKIEDLEKKLVVALAAKEKTVDLALAAKKENIEGRSRRKSSPSKVERKLVSSSATVQRHGVAKAVENAAAGSHSKASRNMIGSRTAQFFPGFDSTLAAEVQLTAEVQLKNETI